MPMPNRFAVALLGGLAWMGATATAAAAPIAIYLITTLYWASDFPFVPGTVSGVSTFSTDARGEIFVSFVDNVDPLAGPTDLTPNAGPLFIDPGETIFWTFDGSLSSGGLGYPVCAEGQASIPAGACNLIPIVTLTSDNFGSFSVTGSIFAFPSGDAVEIGTWEIHANQFGIAEPATVSLLVLGLAGVGLARRSNRPSPTAAPV